MSKKFQGSDSSGQKLLEDILEGLSDEDIKKRLQHVRLLDVTRAFSVTSFQAKHRVIKAFQQAIGPRLLRVFLFNLENLPKTSSDLEILHSTQIVVKALSGREFLDWS